MDQLPCPSCARGAPREGLTASAGPHWVGGRRGMARGEGRGARLGGDDCFLSAGGGVSVERGLDRRMEEDVWGALGGVWCRGGCWGACGGHRARLCMCCRRNKAFPAPLEARARRLHRVSRSLGGVRGGGRRLTQRDSKDGELDRGTRKFSRDPLSVAIVKRTDTGALGSMARPAGAEAAQAVRGGAEQQRPIDVTANVIVTIDDAKCSNRYGVVSAGQTKG